MVRTTSDLLKSEPAERNRAPLGVEGCKNPTRSSYLHEESTAVEVSTSPPLSSPRPLSSSPSPPPSSPLTSKETTTNCSTQPTARNSPSSPSSSGSDVGEQESAGRSSERFSEDRPLLLSKRREKILPRVSLAERLLAEEGERATRSSVGLQFQSECESDESPRVEEEAVSSRGASKTTTQTGRSPKHSSHTHRGSLIPASAALAHSRPPRTNRPSKRDDDDEKVDSVFNEEAPAFGVVDLRTRSSDGLKSPEGGGRGTSSEPATAAVLSKTGNEEVDSDLTFLRAQPPPAGSRVYSESERQQLFVEESSSSRVVGEDQAASASSSGGREAGEQRGVQNWLRNMAGTADLPTSALASAQSIDLVIARVRAILNADGSSIRQALYYRLLR